MPRWRTWLFRGLAGTFVLAIAGGALLAYQVTSGPIVRMEVLSQLQKHFVGADIALGSAQMRLLGGITFKELTFYRRDDPSRTPILHVPSGVIFHDKERLAEGKFAIRKVKLDRPRLVVRRDADGRWNLADILGPVRPDVPIPIIDVQEGTVVVHIAPPIQSPPQAPFHTELRDLTFRALNQSLPVLTITAHGDAGTYGTLDVRAAWQRVHGRLTAAVDLAPVGVGPGLVRELGRFAPDLVEPLRELTGVGRLHADFGYRPDATPVWSHHIRVEIAEGRLVHRELPFPLDNLDLVARCDDGVCAIDRLTAKAGPASVALQMQLNAPASRSMVKRSGGEESEVAGMPPATPHPYQMLAAWLEPLNSLDLKVERLPVTPELFARLPDQFREYQHQFSPAGPLNVSCKLERGNGGWSFQVQMKPEGMTALYHHFPYPLRQVRGALDLTLNSGQPPRLNVNLTAEAAGRTPVKILGTAECDTPAYDYTITATELPINELLLQALPAKFQNQTRAFHPTGHCDVTAHIDRFAGTSQPKMHYEVSLREAAICYDVFPYPLKDVSGALEIRLGPGTPTDPQANTVVKFKEVRGGSAGGRVLIAGEARPTREGHLIDLRMEGERVALDDTLAHAFDPMKLRNFWEMFAPHGRFDFSAEVMREERLNGPSSHRIKVTPRGAEIRPTFFPYALTDLTGTFVLTNSRLVMEPFSARHGLTALELKGGDVTLRPGGYAATLVGLEANPLPVDADFIRALPAALQAVFRALNPTGTLAIGVQKLSIEQPPALPGPPQPPVIRWNGGVNFNDGAFQTGVAWENVSGSITCSGQYRGAVLEGAEGHVMLEKATVFGQPLRNFRTYALIRPDQPSALELYLNGADLFGGQLGGQARVEFGNGLQFHADLNAINIRLEELGRHNRLGTGNAQLSGLGSAKLYLDGNGHGLDELQGRGSFHVPSGRMYTLPFILDVLKLPSLHVPDRTAFEEAHAEFQIHGRRVEVQHLDLLGSAISLGGKGDLNLDGSDMKMDFYVVWGHIQQVLLPGLRDVPSWLSSNLFALRATGRLGGQYTISPLPVPKLIDPVRQWVERARARTPPAPRGQSPGVRAQKDGS